MSISWSTEDAPATGRNHSVTLRSQQRSPAKHITEEAKLGVEG